MYVWYGLFCFKIYNKSCLSSTLRAMYGFRSSWAQRNHVNSSSSPNRKLKVHLDDNHFGHSIHKFWAQSALITQHNMNGTLKFVSPCAYLTALRFRGLLNGRFSSTKGKISLVALKKQKCLSQFRDKTRSFLALLLHTL